ncbi:MAG: type I restriction-modification system subunit M N-terminal domain-containing protein [Candidatus Nanopelagicales bacterium]
MALTQGELENRLLAAANALRGPIDPADFKTYVFPMLFWKWLSDRWQWEHEIVVAEFGEEVEPEVEDDYHQFAIPDGALWSQVTKTTKNLGVAINKAMGLIQQANPDRLAGIFGDAAWGNKERLPEANLINLINVLDGLKSQPRTM